MHMNTHSWVNNRPINKPTRANWMCSNVLVVLRVTLKEIVRLHSIG